METIQTNNNLLETIQALFHDVITEKKKLENFLKIHPLVSHDIGVKDQINLKLFLIQLLVEEQNSLWETYQKISKIRGFIIPINQMNGRKFEILITYLSNILQELNQLMIYNGYLKISEAMTGNFTNDVIKQHQFFLDTRNLPIESLCGYYSYLNPILRSVFESQEKDIHFLLYDAMCEEGYNTKEDIKGNCSRIRKNIDDTLLVEIRHSLGNILDQNLDYSHLYYENYYNICRILSKSNVSSQDTKKRNRSLTISDYEYFTSLVD